MLNRLFIVVGILAIALIAGAFVVPLFVDWTSYRSRMEVLASAALGTEVRVRGEIEFSLLPQPRLRFGDVVVGPADAPLAEIANAQAEFALTDFLRDRYAITRLLLNDPTVHIRIDGEGRLIAPLGLPATVQQSKVSIADADIEGGTLSLVDDRSGKAWAIEAFNGNVQIVDLRGPFSVQGSGKYGETGFSVRLNTSELNDAGSMHVTAFARPEDDRFSLSLDGIVETGSGLEFSGSSTLHMAPPVDTAEAEVRGDLVMEAKIVANTSQLRLESYTMTPDENRPATRLTGVATVDFGTEWKFDAALSGGVVALAPRDAATQEAEQPYELVTLLGALPEIPMPAIAGQINIDIAELNLRAFAVRDVQVNAQTDGQTWTLNSVLASMPGETLLSAAGTLGHQDGRPTFDGELVVESERLDALSLLWRRAREANPLFNMPGSLAGTLNIGKHGVSLSNGKLVLDGVESLVGFDLNNGAIPALGLTADFGAFDAARSAALLALLPDVSAGPTFGLSFPTGGFQISAEAAVLFDLSASDVVASGGWSAEGVRFDRLAVADVGGARVELSGNLADAFTNPVMSAKGQVSLGEEADVGVLTKLFDVLDTHERVRDFVAASLPAELAVSLSPLNVSGGQILSARGRLGVANVDFSAGLSAGLFKLAEAPLGLAVEVRSQSPFELARQLRLGEVGLLSDDGPVAVSLNIEGSPTNSLEVDARITAGDDEATFFGNVIVSDPAQLRGKGKITFSLTDVASLATFAGAEGVGFGAASGSADLSFTGAQSVALEAIDMESAGVLISGSLNRSEQVGDVLISGNLRASTMDVGALAALIGGPSTLIDYAAKWPDGPFMVTSAPRVTRGRVHVDVPSFRWQGRDVAGAGQFDLAWDDRNLRLRSLEAEVGGGLLELDIGICCSNNLADRQVSGRVNVRDIDIAALLPKASAAVVSGRLDGGASFSGTGASFAAVMEAFSGQGSFSVHELSVARFDPTAFSALGSIDNVLELEGDALTAIVESALEMGSFDAVEAGGVFSVAAGTLRVSNMAIEGTRGQLLGDVSISLDDLELGGDWTLSPSRIDANTQLVTSNNARVTAILSGSLDRPQRTLDLAPLVDGLKVRAYELEVDRLETLRAEKEERDRLAAAERALLMELRAKQLAEEELARVTAEEAAILALEAAERDANSLGLSQDPLLAPSGDSLPLDLLGNPVPSLQPLDLTGEGVDFLN